MTLGMPWAPNGATIGTIGSIVLGPAVNGMAGAVLGAVVAVLGAVVAVPDAILTPFCVCTTKSYWANGLDVLTSNLSLKSSPLTREEISDAGPELEAERAGLDIIHASSWGKAEVQCCLPLWLALALASTKDLLSLLHCLDVKVAHQGCTRQPLFDIEGRKHGRHETT